MTYGILDQIAKDVGDVYGYGALMDAARQAWAKTTEHPGSEFTIGPCSMMTVVCPHLERDENGHCSWCCGAGWVTERVLKAQVAAHIEG